MKIVIDIPEQIYTDIKCGLEKGSYDMWLAVAEGQPLSEDVKSIVHARWENGHCSNCHVFIPDDIKTILRDYCDNDFCPNCGAIMDGEPIGERGTE